MMKMMVEGNSMSGAGKYKFYEWDEATFVLPEEYILYNNSDLADALNVFYRLVAMIFS